MKKADWLAVIILVLGCLVTIKSCSKDVVSAITYEVEKQENQRIARVK